MDPQQISSAAKVLMEEKAALVVAIESSDADKKALGRRIRDVNAALAEEAAPIVRGLDDELEELAQATHSAAVLGDRTYPFCLWDAREVADKVR
jgi:predicted Rossmann fold nucleotide-binding protein DprA/Smf involved in DNA uptake